ncbi:MAG TPA: hypothetical protein VK675_01455 [Candidatus Paceibacterota bacterium]|nr:hypothetical protein [Candidatus Paceibacterota bacterium]
MKQKRYWLRGGIIAVIIGAIFLIINLISIKYFNTEAFNYPIAPGIFLGITFNYLAFKCDFWNGGGSWYCDTTGIISIIAFNLIIYFLAGILIGWLYGKIIKRNKVS